MGETKQTTTESPKKPEAHGGLTLGFKLPDGSKQNVDFGTRKPPLGLDLGKGAGVPAVVQNIHAGGYADGLGVKVHWVVESVNGESVEGWPFEKVFALMKKTLSS